MSRPLFLPSFRQAALVAAVTAAALGYAAYLRYGVIEQSAIGIACGGNGLTWLCRSRSAAILLFNQSAFGGVAIGAAMLNLVRPSIVLCLVAMLAAGFGIVLYNVGLSALAVALLVLSLARAAPEPE
jgi:hypothetical protein